MTCKDCIHYEVCKRFIELSIQNGVEVRWDKNAPKSCVVFRDKAKCIVLPCKIRDEVYISRICGNHDDGSPIWKMERGRVYRVEIDSNDHTKFWVGAEFGVLYCCRPHTDFYYSKEDADAKLKELNGDG